MFRRITVFLLFLGLSCSDMIFERSSADYFPLVTGSEWKYLVGETTTYVRVTGDSSIGNRSCTVVTVDFMPEFWFKEPCEIHKFFYRTISRGGSEWTLESRYGSVYRLPFVAANSWQDLFQDTVLVLGDTILYYHRLEANVTKIEDVATPAGIFGQCYRLEFTEEIRAFDTTTTRFTEWLAPGIGLVKSRTGNEEKVLVEYHIGPLSE